MEFTLSIPTLLICGIFFLLFRVLDKKNRSLEKLKRFSDKTKEDLGVFIKEKSVELNDIALNIDTQLKKGREILKRILSFEEMLEGKAEDFEKMKKTVDSYSGTLDELINMSGRVDENLKRLGEESESVEKMGVKLKDTGARLAKLDTDLKTAERRFADQAHGELKELEERLFKAHDLKIHDLLGDVGRMEQRAGDLEAYLKRLETKKQEAVKHTETAIAAALKAFADDVSRKRAQETTGFKSDIDGFLQTADQKNAAMTENLRAVESRLKELDGECGAKIDDFKDQFGQVERMYYAHLENAAKRGEDFEDEVFLNLKKTIDERARANERDAEKYFQTVHATLDKRKKEIVDLFGALRGDTNIWHAELKKQMKEQETEIGLKLKNLEVFAHSSIENYTATAQKAKATADELFRKITAESAGIEERILASIQKRLDEYEDEVHYRFAKLEKASVDVDALDSSLRETMESTAQRIRGDFDAFARELDEARTAERERAEQSLALLRGEIESIEAGVSDLKKKAYENVSSRLKVVEDEFFAGVRLQGDELKKKIGEWREEIMRHVTEAEAANGTEIDKLGASHQRRFEKELAALRKTLEGECQALEGRAGRFEREFDERLTAKEELLAGLSAGLAKEVESVREKALAQIAALGESMEKSRDKAFAQQKAFLDSFDQKRRDLEASLAEIERAQKAFASQTKVFERADSLKLSLEADIVQMKKDLGKIETYRKDIDGIAKEFFATKKIVEDTNAKMRDFLTEKKRIDIIEVDFSKLVALSKSIDEKLETATSQHDLLQGLEVKFRELESLETDVEQRYTRLEGRKNVIEAVTSSVDKNFEALTTLEKNLKAYEREMKSLPKIVGDVKKEVDFIAENREKTEKVAGKIEKLDDTLADIEARMEKLSVARDWLARTETRLEKVGKQAEDQLKLLETLVKDDVSRFKKERGAPSLDKRQMVTQLARKGWSAEEIARATKLSRGEVELILELISDKVAK